MPDFSKVLLTVDYDRTLTGPDAKVPQRNIDAIRWFMDHGGTFTVNTGRSINTFGVHVFPDLMVIWKATCFSEI